MQSIWDKGIFGPMYGCANRAMGLRANRQRFGFIACCVLALLVMTASLTAQEYRGVIYGQVKDATGAVIPNATVTVTSAVQSYRGTTTGNGSFTIPFVQPGRYTVRVSAQGFKVAEQTNVFVDIAQKSNLNFVLQVGAANETVTVETNTLALNTADASSGTVIDPEKVQNLPLNGRQVYMLLALTPGVKFTQTSFGAAGGYSGTRGWDESNAYSISGQSGSYNQFMLGGAPISQQDGSNAGKWNISPSIDAIQQVKVMTATYDAQYGRVGGGAVNIVIKSGTPHFHGTAYDFWRNSVLDANVSQYNQINAPRPYHNQHQYGGTIGGPFLKKNAYFFFSFEGWREVLPAAVIATVPTPDMYPDGSGNVNLSGYIAAENRGHIYDPLSCATGDVNCVRTQFPNDTIPANRISPIGLKVMKLFPLPNRPGYDHNYVLNGKDRYRYNMPIARVDYNFTDKTRMYGEFAWWSGTEFRNNSGLPGPAMTGNIDNYRSSLTQVLDLTHTFSQSLVSDVRLSFNRTWDRGPSGSIAAGIAKLTPKDLGLTMPAIPTTSRQWAPEFHLNDGYPQLIGNTGDPSIYETYDLGPSLTQVIHQHNLHYGGEFALYHDITGGVGQPNGRFDFNDGFTQKNPFRGGSPTDGSVIASLLLGYPSAGSVQDALAPYESYKYYGLFVQDDWKVKSNLTLNIGLRWDTETSPVERHNHLLAGICLTCTNPITSQITFPPGNVLPNGATMANPLLGVIQFASNKLTAYDNYSGEFQPKFGFSYAARSNIVFRGGWELGKAIGIELGGASAWNQSTSYNTSPDGGVTPTGDFRSGTPYPNGYVPVPGDAQGELTLVGQGFGIDQRNRRVPLVQQYTFGFQAQLPGQMIADIGYLGSHTTALRASRQFNGLSAADFQKGHADPNYLNQNVTNPFYGVLPKNVSMGQNPKIQVKNLMVPYPAFNGNIYVYTDPRGYSNYNSMIAKLEKRLSGGGALSRGLSFLGSFTWSKLMTGNSYLNNSGAGLVDPAPYYAVDGNDRSWQLAFSGLYGLPIGRGGLIASNAHGLLGTVINGWQLDWIFQNQSGTPVGYPNGDLYNCGAYSSVPSHTSWSSYINNSQPSCFAKFPQYTARTMLPRTTAVRNPWAQQTQLGLEKKFAVTERATLQFKAEAFNATNTPIFGGPDTGNPEQAPVPNTRGIALNQPGGYTGYGTIGSNQQNFPRQLQMSLKLLF